jgi:hypothetical protein
MNTLDVRKVSFSSKSIFGEGFATGQKKAVNVLGTILESNILKLDGSIALEDIPKWKKYEIWSYIYYLWHYNRTHIQVFSDMTHQRGKKAEASAKTFLTGMYSVMDKNNVNANAGLPSIFTKERLIVTVNKIIKDNKDISIPILQRLYKKLLNSGDIPGLSQVKRNVNVKIPNNSKSNIQVKVDKIQVKTDGNYIAKVGNDPNSDIKVAFGINLIPKDQYSYNVTNKYPSNTTDRYKKEQNRLELQRLEDIRLEQIRLEQQRIEQQRLERQRLDQQRLEELRRQ